MIEISIGRTVLYTLTEPDAVEINRRRTTGQAIADAIKLQAGTDRVRWPLGAQAHIGNWVSKGDVFPMVVVKVGKDMYDENVISYVNGQVLLDGSDVFWATVVSEGTTPGTWKWPPRV